MSTDKEVKNGKGDAGKKAADNAVSGAQQYVRTYSRFSAAVVAIVAPPFLWTPKN